MKYFNLKGSKVLDGLKGDFLACSLRKLRTNYSGACFRVRRSSDDSELDIYFNGNNFDIDALNAFVGSDSGFITIWYDQNNNQNNLIQATPANQPRIIDSGTLDAGVFFDGSAYKMASSFSASSVRKSVFVVFKMNSLVGVNTILAANYGYNLRSQVATGKLVILKEYTGDIFYSASGFGTSKAQATNIFDYSNSTFMRKNKTANGSGNISGTFNANLTTFLGSSQSSTNYFNGLIYELIVFNYKTDISTTAKIEQSQFSQI